MNFSTRHDMVRAFGFDRSDAQISMKMHHIFALRICVDTFLTSLSNERDMPIHPYEVHDPMNGLCSISTEE